MPRVRHRISGYAKTLQPWRLICLAGAKPAYRSSPLFGTSRCIWSSSAPVSSCPSSRTTPVMVAVTVLPWKPLLYGRRAGDCLFYRCRHKHRVVM